MRIYLLIGFFLIAFLTATAQHKDSLKKVLPTLKDSARVDYLNALSNAYLVSQQPDTAQYYTEMAYAESAKLNYVHGMAESKSLEAEIAMAGDDFPKAERLSREALQLYANTANKRRLAETYSNLGIAQYAQSYFREAINNNETAYKWYKQNNDQKGMFWSLSILSLIYGENGNYEKAFELDTKALDLAVQNNDDEFQSFQLIHIARLFRQMGDYKTAFDYSGQAYTKAIPDSFYYLTDYAELYTLRQQYDSAKYYYSLIDTFDNRSLRFYLASTGEYYLAQGLYNKALPNFLRSLNYNKEKNDRNQVMRLLLDIAKTYLGLHDNAAALTYGQQGLSIAKETEAKQFIRDGNQILYWVYDAERQTDSAYYYYKAYIKMRDSILNDQIKAKLIAYGPQQKIELLHKEKEIQQAKLQKESIIKNSFIAGSIGLLLLGFIISRNIILKRKNEKLRLEYELELQQSENQKTKAELEQQATELKMQALRAQMNPHFIFNSLSSINRYILQNDKVQASRYLTKFSKLVRLILHHSGESFTTLECELSSLQLYLELEALRFDNQFSHKIVVAPDIDASSLNVPPLLIQPFVENAIWHGLMHKKEKGHVQIELYRNETNLYCKITDDGVGRKRSAELKSASASTHKSMGMQLTAERIALQQQKQVNSTIRITDLVLPDGSPAGTEVLFQIPIYD